MRLLFVCTGNTCRSPLAEVVGRAEAEVRGLADVECASAGAFAFPGNPAAGPGIAVAAADGLDLTGHVSQELSAELLEWADLVIGMDHSHIRAVNWLAPEVPTHVMSDFLPPEDGRRGQGVPDPIGGDLDTYGDTLTILQQAIRGLFDVLEDETEVTDS